MGAFPTGYTDKTTLVAGDKVFGYDSESSTPTIDGNKNFTILSIYNYLITTATTDNITEGTTNKFASTTNIAAAGATMNTDTTLVGKSWFLDEDDFASDSATKVPSQQSVKTFVSSLGAITGEIKLWATDTPPTNWLIADGSAISRTSYADLFATIGTTYGSGDGSTTFNIPNLQGNVPVGKDGGTFSNLGGTGGEESHVLTINEMPSHSHDIQTYGSSLSGNNIGGNTEGPQNVVSTATEGGDAAHNNLQPYLVVNFIIKT